MSSTANKFETPFTARDFQLLAKAMNCMKTELAVDYAKLAEVGGFKNSNSAKASWHTLKKKLDRAGEGSVSYAGEPDTTGVPTSTTPKSKKRKGAADEERAGDEGDEEPVAPAKSVKKGRKPKVPSAAAKAKAEAEAMASVEKPDGEMEEDGAVVKDEADDEDGGDGEGKVKEEGTDDE